MFLRTNYNCSSSWSKAFFGNARQKANHLRCESRAEEFQLVSVLKFLAWPCNKLLCCFSALGRTRFFPQTEVYPGQVRVLVTFPKMKSVSRNALHKGSWVNLCRSNHIPLFEHDCSLHGKSCLANHKACNGIELKTGLGVMVLIQRDLYTSLEVRQALHPCLPQRNPPVQLK